MKNHVSDKQILLAKQTLAKQIEAYVKIIRAEYKSFIPEYITKYLDSISDFQDIIRIEETGTISLFVSSGIMYFPLSTYEILGMMKLTPGFGINKKHSTYTKETIIINDNTFLDYIKHVFIAGLTPVEFFEETLLHETLHLCGLGGASALQEGFTELKTRELAAQYNLKTSACGYPKEVKIAYAMQNILGKEVCNRLVFASDDMEIYNILNTLCGEETARFYLKVSSEMEKSFTPYYEKNYPGIMGPLHKAKEYEKINYDIVHQMINDFETSIFDKKPLL